MFYLEICFFLRGGGGGGGELEEVGGGGGTGGAGGNECVKERRGEGERLSIKNCT